MRGRWTPKLDDKYRLTLPAKYRDELTDEVTIVRESEHCLSIYARHEFDTRLAKINDGPSTVQRVRQYQRWINSNSEDLYPDKQGRITLSQRFREWADIDKDVVLIGAGNRLEAWNPAAFETQDADLDALFVNFDGFILPGESTP